MLWSAQVKSNESQQAASLASPPSVITSEKHKKEISHKDERMGIQGRTTISIIVLVSLNISDFRKGKSSLET